MENSPPQLTFLLGEMLPQLNGLGAGAASVNSSLFVSTSCSTSSIFVEVDSLDSIESHRFTLNLKFAEW